MEIAYIYAFTSVVIVSLLSLVGIFTLSLNERLLNRSIFILLSLAVGALFGDAIIHLLPEAFEQSKNPTFVSFFALLGIVSFFILEKFLHWHHHGHHSDEARHHDDILATDSKKIKPLGYLILTSDGVHNLIDGIIIGASYLISIEVGIATTIAVILHEIPQEIADFGVLIHSGFTKGRALLFNFGTALFAFLGAALAFLVGSASTTAIPYITAFAAGHFIYIAGADLVPELQKTSNLKNSFVQLIAILFGLGLMFALLLLN